MASQLSPELWIVIVGFVAIPINDDSPAAWRARIRRRQDAATAAALVVQYNLNSLCLTSRQLQSVTTPFLYAAPVTSQPFLFIRTIMESPDLTHHVKSLSHTMWNHWPSSPPSDMDPRFVGLVREYDARLMRYMHAERKRLQGDSYQEPPNTQGDADEEIPWNFELLEGTTLGLLPDLTDLAIRNAFMPVFRGMMRNSLPNLLALKVQFDWGGAAQLAPRTLDWLTLVAPNLRSLTMTSIARMPEAVRIPSDEFWGDRADDHGTGADDDHNAPWSPSWQAPVSWFANVTSLCFRRCILAQDRLPTMLRGFPALESLHFDIEPTDGNPFNTAVLQAALLEHTPGLRKLRVDISRFHSDVPYDDHKTMTWSPALAELRNLQVLVTSVKLLSRETGSLMIFSPMSKDGLVAIMPPGLKVLAIKAGSSMSSFLTPALMGLAEAVESGGFTSLRKVLCGGKDQGVELPKGMKALRELGVDAMAGDFSVMCSETGDNLGCLRHYHADA